MPLVGQRVAWINDREVALCANADTHDTLTRVTSRAIHAWGLNASEARVLFLTANGARTPVHRASIMALRRLVGAQILTVDPIPKGRHDDEPRLTDTTRYNLCLNELGLGDTRTIPSKHTRPPATKRTGKGHATSSEVEP